MQAVGMGWLQDEMCNKVSLGSCAPGEAGGATGQSAFLSPRDRSDLAKVPGAFAA